MSKKSPEQFLFNFEEQKDPEVKSGEKKQISEVETPSGTVRIISGPTRTEWDGLAPQDEGNYPVRMPKPKIFKKKFK